MKKVFLLLLLFITNFINLRCGIPSPDSVQQLNTPSISVGTKSANGSYFNYSQVHKVYSPQNYIRIQIQAYQPETDFSGFMIYINNSVDTNPSYVVPDDGTKYAIQTAQINHYYYESSRGNYPKQAPVEARYIVSASSATSGLYPTISINALASINTVSPLTEPAYPALTRYPVEFYFYIYWDGKGSLLTFGAEKKYNIAITAVDVASKLESKLSNIIQVRFNGVAYPGAGDNGDFNYDS